MTKVCPECGGHVFQYYKTIPALIVCDGNGKTINVEPPAMPEPTEITCITCKHNTQLDKLVTEDYFHLVICGDDEGDENESAS